jgi:hypothetical protein
MGPSNLEMWEVAPINGTTRRFATQDDALEYWNSLPKPKGGTSNFVTYNDQIPNITARNGVPVE